MSQDLDLSLSRRAVAAGWKWQKGALILDGIDIRVMAVRANGHLEIAAGDMSSDTYEVKDWMLPDFRDAATRGCLLEQVRQRRNAPHGFVICQRSRCASRDYAPNVWDWTWSFWDDTETFAASGDSEVAALVTALESIKEEVRVEN